MTAVLMVLAPGPALLIQDGGRPGYAHLAVPPSGALDVGALRLANRLVGNDESAAGLEVLFGARLRCLRSTRVAMTGAPMSMLVGRRAMPWGEPLSLRAGDELTIQAGPSGLRAWLAVAGGIVAAPVLGSRATDTLTGLGPPKLDVGDLIAAGEPGDMAADAAALATRHDDGVPRLAARIGPRDDWFSAAAIDRLAGEAFVVSVDSDRVGIRLWPRSARPFERVVRGELASEGIVTGAIQVPGSGFPLVFLADHPVTGGYPVIAVLDESALATCAQLRPGDHVRFALSA